MATQYVCRAGERRRQVNRSREINGIDYLEVAPDQKTLEVHLFPKEEGAEAPDASVLTKDKVLVEGGSRVRDVRVDYVRASANVLIVALNKRGDFSTYRLRLVSSTSGTGPPAGFDQQLSEIEFSFERGYPNEVDCAGAQVCPETTWPAPQIDYLAKDYASFRRLMLDRLAVIMPEWRERNPADLGIVLVELLAYAADQLSYYQDAVATEAYLGTARKRVSVRRHARLLDYPMHDGSNARAWVTIMVKPGVDEVTLPGPSDDRPGSMLLTQIDAPSGAVKDVPAITAGTEVFETLHAVTLRAAHNEMCFYTWGDEECCLPKGATHATLRGHLGLRRGDVLIFEEVMGPKSGLEADADPARRHVVRLTEVSAKDQDREPLIDPLYNQEITEIEWHPEDALPFPLCISARADEERGRVEDISVARGNVVLADHGRTISGEELSQVPKRGLYHPRLEFGPLTQQGYARDRLVLDDDHPVLYDREASASAALRWEPRDVLPAIKLRRDDNDRETWRPRRDLLNSDRFAAEFVAETEEDGSAFLRFGDGVTGRPPVDGLKATYRCGNGRAGNVGAEAIAHVVTEIDSVVKSVEDVRNPLPATGGTDPEPIEQVRLYAPHAFRKQERAVTGTDYEVAAQRHPEVQRATATRRWTGSWYTWFMTVDRRGGRPVDAEFEGELREFLERFRLAGYDLEVDAPRFVALDIALTVRVRSGYIRASVKHALLETFGDTDLPDGRRGFFHPDNFTFGQPVYLSKVVATAMKVPGVSRVEPVRFQRWGEEAHNELKEGRITFDRLEIARLDNDPNAPANGKLELHMEGGL